MFIPSTFKRPVSSWNALNIRKTLLMASSVRLKPLYCSRLVFFFQAEDGIRDGTVTGVQTCALPISYSKLGREEEAIATSKRIAEAYVQMGQISSAILEYETILQRVPEDQDVKKALLAIESKSGSFPMDGSSSETSHIAKKPGLITPLTTTTGNGLSQGAGTGAKNGKPAQRVIPKDCDDGRRTMQKIFVGSKAITQADFDQYWTKHDFSA